jgi:class 3 adenylate cyclase
LKELGVMVVGHRRRLLDGIIALQGEPVVTLGGNAPTRGDGTGSAPAGAERRQLSVLFCDLVGSTTLASRTDPEDLCEVIGGYHRCVAGTVARFDGFVANYMGDGALVYFGYPQAHEDDPERVVRAGLALVDAVGRLQAPEPLGIRVGIGTGQVVVGDLITSGEGQERGIVGETPNLAARLQALAEPGTVVIGPQTRRLLGDLFECRDPGSGQPVRSLSGIDGAMEGRLLELRLSGVCRAGSAHPQPRWAGPFPALGVPPAGCRWPWRQDRRGGDGRGPRQDRGEAWG